MVSRSRMRSRDELGGILANRPPGCGGQRIAVYSRNSVCGVDHIFPLAVEVLGRGSGRTSHRAAANRAGVLRPDDAWKQESTRTMVGVAHRTHLGIHI